jgi:hypothetical protein
LTQVLSSLQAFTLAYLTFSHHIGIYDLVVLSAVRGCINAFDTPARTALLPTLAGNQRDQSAILALDSVVVNLCRVAGPFLAGLLLATRGEAACFLGDGISYAASFSTLLMVRKLPSEATSELHVHIRMEGWKWLRGHSEASRSLVLLCVTSLLALPFTVLLPFYVKNVLHAGPAIFGLLGTVSSGGAIVALCLVASLCDPSFIAALGRAGMVGSGIALIGFSVVRTLPATLIVVFLISFSIMIQIAATNVYLQSVVSDRLRGRITVFYSAAFCGMVPFGSLLLGASARLWGCPATFAGGGVLCLLTVLIIGTRIVPAKILQV